MVSSQYPSYETDQIETEGKKIWTVGVPQDQLNRARHQKKEGTVVHIPPDYSAAVILNGINNLLTFKHLE